MKEKTVVLADEELGVIIAAIYADKTLWEKGRPADALVEKLLHKLVEAKEGTIRAMILSDNEPKNLYGRTGIDYWRRNSGRNRV